MSAIGALRLTFHPSEHPRSSAPPQQPTGVLLFVYKDEMGERVLVSFPCDMSDVRDFSTWLTTNRVFLTHDDLPPGDSQWPSILPGESLAQARNRLKRRRFSTGQEHEAEEWYDLLYQFYCRHCPRSSLLQTRIPPVYLGMNSVAGEVSVSYQAESPELGIGERVEWAYYHDIQQFVAQAEQMLKDVLDRSH